MSTSGLLDEKSLALLQRLDTLSDDERLEDKKDILKALKDPDTISKFVEDCKKTGQTAVAIDTSFKRVHEGFDEIIKKYSKDFPELKEYSARWDGFKAVSELLFFYFMSSLNNHRLPCASVGMGHMGCSGSQGTLRPSQQVN